MPRRSLLTAMERDGEAGKILGLLKQLADSGEVNQVRWIWLLKDGGGHHAVRWNHHRIA